MSWFYRMAYRIGLTPWEELATLPISRQISSLLDREEHDRVPPYGAALDLGCGSGIWTLELIRRGFRVTGIDIVPKALSAARRRLESAGVEAKLVQGDMTALREANIDSEFEFVLDFGAIHGMRDEERKAAGREVTAVTSTGATMLLLAWVPASRGPLPRGMSADEIRETFPRWRLVAEDPADVSGAPRFVRNARPCFYRLLREP